MIRIALAQINPTVGNFNGNEKKIIDAAARAARRSADIVLFPELAVSGYPPEDLLFKKNFIRAAAQAVENIAQKTRSITAIVGFPHHEGGRLFNAAAVLNGGFITSVIHKTHLPNYGVFDEERYFSPAESVSPVETAGVKSGVTICEDIWVGDGLPAELCAAAEVELIVNLSSSPFHIGKEAERCKVACAWAKRFKKPLAYCNLVGGQDELVFDGGSFVCDGQGEIIAAAKQFSEDLLIVDLPVGSGGPKTGAPSRVMAPSLDYPENVFEALVLGVRDYVYKNGFEKTIVAISGGIDSALTLAVAVAALGGDRVRGVAMPSPYSSGASLSDARELAANYRIPLDVVPITDLMGGFDEALKELFTHNEQGTTEENIQARIRGTLMMALSNRFGHLVLTTGNKSELGVGYCTLYGDMAGGFAVIKDLPKMMVYELANWINKQSELPDIPRSIVEKEPSAELRPNQKDSDALPEYSSLDPILKLYVEDEKSIEEIISLGYSERDAVKVVKLVDRNEYKRRQAPPGVRITPRAFGKDRRMPITNQFKDRGN